MRILIVEDSPTDRQLLRFLLEEHFREDAKFREADNLGTACRYLEMGNIDCVLLDLQLPDSAGKETFEKIVRRFPSVPVVVMTHNRDQELAMDMIRSGASDFILKSYTDSSDIFRRILFAVEKHHRMVRMSSEKVASVHELDQAKANLVAAQERGEPEAIRDAAAATTVAIADMTRRMFTEIQELTILVSQQGTRQEELRHSVKTLETEVLNGTDTDHSMKSRLEIIEHRLKSGDHGKDSG